MEKISYSKTDYGKLAIKEKVNRRKIFDIQSILKKFKKIYRMLLIFVSYISYFTFNKKCLTSFMRSSHSEMFCQKGVLKNFSKLAGKHLCQSLFFNKVAGLRPRLWHRCFPVNSMLPFH